MNPKAPNPELALIERIRRASASRPSARVVLGIGDDCAILRPRPGHEILVTTDFTLEGRHFRRDWHSAESAGHRCLARGLSDLAAMGTKPLAAFLSLAVPAAMLSHRADALWLQHFFTGLRALADRANVPLAGGDTSESPTGTVLADILLLGTAPRGRALRRSGATPGDLLYVTGSLGGSAAELASMQRAGKPSRPLPGTPQPQSFPEPRLGPGQALMRRHLASACMDLSDGLSSDLTQLCQSSGVSAQVELSRLPVHPLVDSLPSHDRQDAVLHGGEDYELLFTAPPGKPIPRRLAGVPVTRIGVIAPAQARSPTVTLVLADGRAKALRPGGWQHFRPQP